MVMDGMLGATPSLQGSLPAGQRMSGGMYFVTASGRREEDVATIMKNTFLYLLLSFNRPLGRLSL